jgi:DNA protecting protein DprA
MSSYPVEKLTPISDLVNFTPDFWQIKKCPPEIFVQGRSEAFRLLERLPQHGLAVVGTRVPQPRSLQVVRRTIQELKDTYIIILSGLAYGIDAAAHQSAIQAGIPTIAVLAGGLANTYPPGNEPLRAKILDSGGHSEITRPPGTPAQPHLFLERNRMIAAWARATWVVEAGQRSGALNTAMWAREHQKVCFTTPCFPGDPALAGNQILMDRDHAIPVFGAHSFGEVWLDFAVLRNKRRRMPPSYSGEPDLFGADMELLSRYVHELTTKCGGAQVQQVLDWAVARSWSPEKFFTTLQRSILAGAVLDERGTLVSSQ